MKYLVAALALFTASASASTIMFESGDTYTLKEGEKLYIMKQIGGAVDAPASPQPAPHNNPLPTATNGWTEMEFYEYCNNEPKLSNPVEFEEFKAKQEWDKVCHPTKKLPYCAVTENIAELCVSK